MTLFKLKSLWNNYTLTLRKISNVLKSHQINFKMIILYLLLQIVKSIKQLRFTNEIK
jgi:hypothetical protein